MSISSALSSALSGLTAASRSADVISSNIANATTDGYSTRRLDLSTRMIGNDGAGVRVNGVVRQVDSVVVGQRRLAEADMGLQRTEANFMARLETLMGTPGDPGSLSARFSNFEASLVTATNAPWVPSNLENAVSSAKSVAQSLNALSNSVQDERLNADAQIGRTIDSINSALEGLEDLNVDILSSQTNGGDMASLLDAQSRLVDQISPYIPLQSRRDDSGVLRLYSDDGQTLLDNRAANLGFSRANAMDPYQDYADGDLSGLTINGRVLDMDGPNAAFAGGELQGLFMVRDTWSQSAQARLDGVAMDLAERFDAAGLDTTLTAGDPGLFTDAGALVNASNEVGLSARLSVNSAADADQGGAAWRLRDGLGALAEGPTGNATILTAMVGTLSSTQPTSSAAFLSGSRSMADLVADNVSIAGFARNAAETELSYKSARFTALESSELANGVDTDDELQRLLKVEQLFSANARVISVAEDLMDEILRIAG